jgi:magnesium chelatase subunit D
LQVARKLLGEIKVSNAMLELTAQYCMKGNVAGHRAEFFMIEAAKTIAALQGRDYLLPADMERAAFFIMPHRMQKEEKASPQQEEQEEQSDEQESEEPTEQTENDNQPQLPSDEDNSPLDNTEENNSEMNESKDTSDEQSESQEDIANQDVHADVDQSFCNTKMAVHLPQDRHVKQGSGKRNLTRTVLKQGRYVRSCLPKGKLTDLALDATLRAAAPYQRFREKGKCCMTIQQGDLRQKVREKRIGNTFLFVVDASGSMGARERMRAVKGAIFSMLQDAYQKRDQVGLIAFRREKAELLLPVTRSVDLAQKCLQQLPTGGGTPLAEGLATAFTVLSSMQKKQREMQPIVVLVTDGRTNRSVNSSGDATGDALKMAEKIKMAGFSSVVIDTETDFIKLGIAQAVARKMGSTYYHLQELSEQNIIHIVKNMQ